MKKTAIFLISLMSLIFVFYLPAKAQSADELSVMRKALEEALRENIALRAELEVARKEIDRLRGGAIKPLSYSAPATVTSANKIHLVQEGETLGGIATKYYGTPAKFNSIFEANSNILSDPNKIYPGQKLVIP